MGPVIAPLLSSILPTAPALGGVVSITTTNSSDGSELLPAGSVTTTSNTCSPSANGCSGVKVQDPSSSTTTSPMTSPLSMMLIVSPGVPTPDKVGWSSSVTPPLPMGPVIVPLLSTAPDTPPLAGAVVSTVTTKPSDSGECVPFWSITTVLRMCSPSRNGLSGVNDQLPLASTMASPMTEPPSRITTFSPGRCPPPENVGRASSVTSPLAKGPTTGP